jgi:hypothetical protein
LLRVSLGHISGNNPNYLNFCKHLIVRAPEKTHLRKSAIHVVTKLTETTASSASIIDFVLKLARSSKVTTGSLLPISQATFSARSTAF